MPRIERLQQNTAEWHRWRQQGLGASDAPVIMGEAAFKTPRMLWSIKTGRMQEDAAGPAARRGRELERLARRVYEQEVGIQMEPLCLVHDQLEWMRASLDGLSFDGSTVLEIKCPMNVRDQSAAQQGSVPPQYYAQLQHELEVSGAEEAHYWSFDGSAGSLVRVRPDREYLKRLLDAEAAFWQLVRENVWPEPAGGELDLSADPKWRHVALRYREAKVRLETAAAEEHKLRAMLESLATARRTFGCGVELLRSSRRGAVDYAAIPGAAWRQSGALPQAAGYSRQDQLSRARPCIRHRWNSSSASVTSASSSAVAKRSGCPMTCSTTCAFASFPTPARRI